MNQKLFWKLLKGQRNSSQSSAFLVNGALITDKNKVRGMWANHFESVGTPSQNSAFDNKFYRKVCDSVQVFFVNLKILPALLVSLCHMMKLNLYAKD